VRVQTLQKPVLIPGFHGSCITILKRGDIHPIRRVGQIVPVSTILAKVVGIRENWHTFLAVLEKN
jgi:phospholipid N-methyltransferase